MNNLFPEYISSKYINGFRSEFPILKGSDYVYLDSGATSLKPTPVVRACSRYLEEISANVGRANHRKAESATAAYEQARSRTAHWINAYSDEIIFTHNCTDSINILAQALRLDPKRRVLISDLEHHSNILPWINRCKVDVVPSDQTGKICLDTLQRELSKGDVNLMALTWVSNVTGNIQPVHEISQLARRYGSYLFLDAAQAAGHFHIDVREIDCDFMAFSSHKMFGPTGVGVLYVKRDRYSDMGLSREGGGMVNAILEDRIIYRSGPSKYEAGTPNIMGVSGHSSAIDFIARYSADAIHEHNKILGKYFYDAISDLDFIAFPFPISDSRIPIFTFVPRREIDINLISKMLCDQFNIAVGAGFQCNQPLYRKKRLQGGIRVSIHAYNTYDDINRLRESLCSLAPFFN